MRILVVSDLHYRLPHYDWLLEAASTVDAVVIAGDLADVVSPVPHEVQTVVISRYLGQLAERTTVLAASGNHDLDGPSHHGEQVARWLRKLTHDGLHVDGSSIDIGDTRFTVCPWWDGPITRAEVGTQLAAAAQDRPARWVWIYHAPPAGTPLCHDGRRTFPDVELAEWIGQHTPDLVFSGLQDLSAASKDMFANAVTANVYIDSIDNFATMNKGYAALLNEVAPSRTTVQTTPPAQGKKNQISVISVK